MANYNIKDVKLLLVEDSFNFRYLIVSVLRAMGAGHIEEASDGEEALRKLRDYDADIVITDWKMAPIDGMELVRRIRTDKDSPNPFVPIIIVSGYSEAFRVLGARDSGANEFLTKPITAKTLWSRILSIIERPRPFIRAKNYFGPDRRRRQMQFTGPERRQEEKKKKEKSWTETQK
ncbi:MAG: response regulator [Proteobacteria bacterium]|nr:response regulator [Pseudomonadota bacterium]